MSIKAKRFWYPSVNAAGAFVHMSNPIEVRQSLSKYTEPAKEFVHNYIPDNELIMSVLDKIGQGTFSLPLISQNITSIDATVTWPVSREENVSMRTRSERRWSL